ncbi:MAG: SRPBCC domain-containing protein [Ignavibacteriales bacterium]|nr:SRPBCC domain-containing protein [Ignavibacteriales bacterium]
MSEKIKVSATFPVSAERIYTAWLNSKEHTAMTGDKATASKQKGKPFTAGDGYISGVNVKLTPFKEIVQSWRSTEFPKKAPDSTLTVTLESVEKGTKVTILHAEIPDGSGEAYKKGWREFYFKPMKAYFK